ncbi:MAG: hypothetical protein HQK99_08770 [Nitrospirae bacterium]|nr:hypothetical protein [Nitrospirota bacterium]
MEFIDYSDFYYREKLKEPPPPQRTGKFVQIRNDTGGDFIILSPKGFSPYHADILRFFCGQRGIDGLYSSELKFFEISDPTWRVTGGGKWSIDEGLKTLRLHGYSQAYGSFITNGLKEGLSKINDLAGYEITIES